MTAEASARQAGGAIADIGSWFDRHCHILYVAAALPLIVWFACWIPAFQSPDEPNHFARADQISRGVIIGTRFGATDSGGLIDAAIAKAQVSYSRLPFNPAAKVTREDIAASRQIPWSGDVQLSGFRNTVNYGPMFYLPQAAGVWIGRHAGLGVIDTLVLARVANGLACCALGFLALRLCAFGKRTMFSVLCWPMTLSLSASSSHDGLLIASAALLFAVASRTSTESRSATSLELALFLVALVGGVMGHPTHIAFALLLPLLFYRVAGRPNPLTGRVRLALVIAAALCLAWIVVVQTYTMSVTLLDVPEEVKGGPSINGQIAFIKSHPGIIPSLIYRSAVYGWKPLITTSIGVLGWLDTLMPSWYYWMGTAAFLIAVVADRRALSPRSGRVTLAGWSAVVVFTVFTYISIYLTWMGVGAIDVLGVQGRYLLAGVPLAAWLLPPSRRAAANRAIQILESGAWIVAVLFVLVTYLVVPYHVLARYYAS
jgi:uncharacterized membrane protein